MSNKLADNFLDNITQLFTFVGISLSNSLRTFVFENFESLY